MSFDQSFLAPDAQRYVESLARLPYPVMERMEREIREARQPAVGRASGSILRTLVAATGGKRVLEVGTNVGYSTLWMASALAEDGHIDTIELDEGLAKRAEANAREAGVGAKVRVHQGAALDVLPRLAGPYDLVFLDCVKSEYPEYLRHARAKLAPRGVLAADNLLWSGRVWEKDPDEDTRGLLEYTRRVTTDAGLVTALVPSEDGLMVSVLRG